MSAEQFSGLGYSSKNGNDRNLYHNSMYFNCIIALSKSRSRTETTLPRQEYAPKGLLLHSPTVPSNAVTDYEEDCPRRDRLLFLVKFLQTLSVGCHLHLCLNDRLLGIRIGSEG